MRKLLLTAAASVALLAAGAASASVTTKIYSGHTDDGGGAPYTDYVGTLVTDGITFATDTGYNWHPFGLFDFGSDSIGSLSVAVENDYTFHLSSDDGAVVYVDGVLLIDRGGPHGPSVTDGFVHLTAGLHSYEVQFFECCGGPSGLDFEIPIGVTFTGGVPEPATWGLMLVGFGGLGAVMRRRRALVAA